MLPSLRGKRWPGRASRRGQRAGPRCAGRAQAAPGSCLPARSKWLCLLLSSGRAPQRIPLCRHQLLSPAGGRRHRRHPRVPGRCSSVPRVPRGTERGVTAGASTPGAPCPRGRAQLAHGAGPGHHLHRWGTTGACGILGGRGIKGGTHPQSSPSSPSTHGGAEKVTKEVSQAPSPLPPCSHHSALPWPILEVSLHNRSAQSLSFSCATTFPLGLPKTDQSAAEQSQQHSQAGFGVCGAGHTPRPHHPVCPIKNSSTPLGHPRTSLVEGTQLSVPISTSPPHSLEQVATVPREGLGGVLPPGMQG